MKKYIILLIVVIILLRVIYVNIKSSSTNKAVVQPTTNIQQTGVELPENQPAITLDTTNTTLPPTYLQVTGCNKTLKDIIEDYGTIWGERSKGVKMSYYFSQEETETILILLSEYMTCTALAKEKPEVCNTLPHDLREVCEAEYYYYKFKEYVIGSDKNIKDCLTFFEKSQDGEVDELKNIGISNINLLCQNIRLGIDKICDNMIKDKSKFSKCYRLFPRSLNDCNGDKKCIGLLQAFESYRDTGNFECSTIFFKPEDREKCEIIRSGQATCIEKLNKLTLTYCGYYSKIMQKKNEELEKLEKEKEAEEIKKKENEIIKRAKEILKKQREIPGGEDGE